MQDRSLSKKLGVKHLPKEDSRLCPNCNQSYIVMLNGGKFLCLYCFISFFNDPDLLKLAIIYPKEREK